MQGRPGPNSSDVNPWRRPARGANETGPRSHAQQVHGSRIRRCQPRHTTPPAGVGRRTSSAKAPQDFSSCVRTMTGSSQLNGPGGHHGLPLLPNADSTRQREQAAPTDNPTDGVTQRRPVPLWRARRDVRGHPPRIRCDQIERFPHGHSNCRPDIFGDDPQGEEDRTPNEKDDDNKGCVTLPRSLHRALVSKMITRSQGNAANSYGRPDE